MTRPSLLTSRATARRRCSKVSLKTEQAFDARRGLLFVFVTR